MQQRTIKLVVDSTVEIFGLLEQKKRSQNHKTHSCQEQNSQQNISFCEKIAIAIPNAATKIPITRLKDSNL